MHKIVIPEVGEVELRKSKRARRLILKINQDGKAVVTLPSLVPFKVAENFVTTHISWLKENLAKQQPVVLEPGKSIGKKHTLKFSVSLKDIQSPKSHVDDSNVTITHLQDQHWSSETVQAEAKKAAIRALRREAEAYLPPLLHSFAQKFNYSYREVRIKAAQTRWGSCSSNKVINLSVWLMQLPDELIEYVLCHELTHLKHMNHQATFWQELSLMIPDYKERRKKLKLYRPALM